MQVLGKELAAKGVRVAGTDQEAFTKIVKKESKYVSESPFRGVAKLGGQEYAFALDVKDAKSKGYNRLYFDFNHNGDLTDDKVDRGRAGRADRWHTLRLVRVPAGRRDDRRSTGRRSITAFFLSGYSQYGRRRFQVRLRLAQRGRLPRGRHHAGGQEAPRRADRLQQQRAVRRRRSRSATRCRRPTGELLSGVWATCCWSIPTRSSPAIRLAATTSTSERRPAPRVEAGQHRRPLLRPEDLAGRRQAHADALLGAAGQRDQPQRRLPCADLRRQGLPEDRWRRESGRRCRCPRASGSCCATRIDRTEREPPDSRPRRSEEKPKGEKSVLSAAWKALAGVHTAADDVGRGWSAVHAASSANGTEGCQGGQGRARARRWRCPSARRTSRS